MALTPKQLAELRRAPVGPSGNRVGVAMKLVKLKQIPVAQGTGLAQPYVSAVVSGRFNTVTVTNAHLFADFFGCTIEDLFPSKYAVVA